MAKSFVGITGTTSVGKSAVAVELAKLCGAEILSADSMQVYKYMDVGTAKVTEAEKQGVVHHMLDVLLPNQDYSSFLYQQQASEIIDGLDVPPIVVGGTGFYFDSLLFPPEFENADENLRQTLKEKLQKEGLQSLQQMLLEMDEETYRQIDVCNPVRVLRALEIASTGKSKSGGTHKERKPRYDAKIFVLQRNRQDLYEQIDKRVDQMMQNGLLEEVERLVAMFGFVENSAFSAIGYKEIIEFLQGKCTLEQAIDKIKTNTRHYAKRQISYFKRLCVAEFIDVDGKDPRDIAHYIFEKYLQK